MCDFDCVHYGHCNKETECENCEDYICNPCDICTGNHCKEETETNSDVDCYDCKKWKKGRADGTCIHYINNDCPYGYHDSDENNISE